MTDRTQCYTTVTGIGINQEVKNTVTNTFRQEVIVTNDVKARAGELNFNFAYQK
jgi:hypothetical protein